MKITRIGFYIFLALFSACTYSSVKINRKEDDIDGKIFLHKFYSETNELNFEKLDNLASDTLKIVAGQNGLSNLIKDIHKDTGNYINFVVDDYYITNTSGSKNEISYNYKLKVKYEKGVVEEVIGFRKNDGSDIHIISYHANSNTFKRN